MWKLPICWDTLVIKVGRHETQDYTPQDPHMVSAASHVGPQELSVQEAAPFSIATGQWQHIAMCSSRAAEFASVTACPMRILYDRSKGREPPST